MTFSNCWDQAGPNAGGCPGTLLLALALLRGSATSAGAAVFAIETAVPALVGLVLLGDRARPALGPLGAAGFVATVGGALVLACAPTAPQAGAPRPDVGPAS